MRAWTGRARDSGSLEFFLRDKLANYHVLRPRARSMRGLPGSSLHHRSAGVPAGAERGCDGSEVALAGLSIGRRTPSRNVPIMANMIDKGAVTGATRGAGE